MKQTLQKIIFPDRKICNIQDMFFRTKKEIYEEETEKIIFESNSTLDEVVSFNTYFNTFSFFKWEKSTKLNNLGFSFKFKGKVRLKFYSAKLFKDEIISGITIKDIIITIKTTKTIDRLIAKTSFILLFFFKYFSIGSKRIAIKIAIIKVIKYPVHLPIIVEKFSGFVKYDCNITKIKIIPVIFIIFFKFI